MPSAISKAKHDKLATDLQVFLSNLPFGTGLNLCLRKEAFQLQQLFDSYKCTLSPLQDLIKKYETKQHVIKVELRKQKMANAKQKLSNLFIDTYILKRLCLF